MSIAQFGGFQPYIEVANCETASQVEGCRMASRLFPEVFGIGLCPMSLHDFASARYGKREKPIGAPKALPSPSSSINWPPIPL